MRLLPHAVPAPACVRGLDARATRAADGTLELSWRLDADLDRLCIPAPGAGVRTNGLWRHTCFEAFIAAAGSTAYCELNFSPSGAWAAYAFTGYRAGMQALDLPEPPHTRWRRDAQRLTLDVSVRPGDLAGFLAHRPLRLGLSAVIEQQSGTISHWALLHPAGKPDFHHADGFVIELDPPVTSPTGGTSAT